MKEQNQSQQPVRSVSQFCHKIIMSLRIALTFTFSAFNVQISEEILGVRFSRIFGDIFLCLLHWLISFMGGMW